MPSIRIQSCAIVGSNNDLELLMFAEESKHGNENSNDEKVRRKSFVR